MARSQVVEVARSKITRFHCNKMHDYQKTCIDCGSVLGNVHVINYKQRDSYSKYVNNI